MILSKENKRACNTTTKINGWLVGLDNDRGSGAFAAGDWSDGNHKPHVDNDASQWRAAIHRPGKRRG